MEYTWFIIVGLGLLGIIAIRWASRIMAFVMGIVFIALAVMGVMYVMQVGPFRKDLESLNGLEKKFCEKETDQNKCDCIVEIIENDIRKRFSVAEIEELENNRLLMMGAAIKSFQAREKEIDQCLEERNAEHEKQEFIEEVFDGNGMIGKAKGLINDFVEDYKMVDDKY